MSRLTDLIAKAKADDPQMGADLEREFRALSSRLSFGLNFERHQPEAVEIPRRPIRRGDKVRVLPPRGSTTKGDVRLWKVKKLIRNGKVRQAKLESLDNEAESCTQPIEDLVVVSHRPSDVSRTILSQCNNFLILRLTNDRDQSVVSRLVPDSMNGLMDMLPLLDTGEALLLGDAVLLPTRIKLDKPEICPTSGTRDFWKEWGAMAPDVDAIAEAVETLRRQTRPV